MVEHQSLVDAGQDVKRPSDVRVDPRALSSAYHNWATESPGAQQRTVTRNLDSLQWDIGENERPRLRPSSGESIPRLTPWSGTRRRFSRFRPRRRPCRKEDPLAEQLLFHRRAGLVVAREAEAKLRCRSPEIVASTTPFAETRPESGDVGLWGARPAKSERVGRSDMDRLRPIDVDILRNGSPSQCR